LPLGKLWGGVETVGLATFFGEMPRLATIETWVLGLLSLRWSRSSNIHLLLRRGADNIATSEQIPAVLVGSSGAGVEVADMKAWEASDMSAWGTGKHHQRVQ